MKCTWKFPIVVQSINFGFLRVAYGYDPITKQLFGGYRSSYEKDIIGLLSNFNRYCKENDLTDSFDTIISNLTTEE